jgi:hypothetical protein
MPITTAEATMQDEARWKLINDLDEELLKGGVILSEWCSIIVKEADVAFVSGANLATIIVALAGIETYLRSEYGSDRSERLYDLIERSPIQDSLKSDLHTLRVYRNKWVHISDPWDDQALLNRPEEYEQELESMATVAVRALRRAIYENQWI